MSKVKSIPNEASSFAVTRKNEDNKEMKMDWLVSSTSILQDNFGHVIHSHEKAIVVDPGESATVSKFLKS
jgi:hypothetical protein